MHMTAVDPVCEDLCFGILEELPSRTLVQIRSTSRIFADLVDEILRRRFLNIITGGANDLLLESCPPYATRGAHREPLVFSHFGPAVDRARTGDIAHLRPKTNGLDRIPYYLPLDDGEVFTNNHVAIHLRQRDAISFDSDDDLNPGAAGGATGGFGVQLARPLQPRGFGYLNSIKIATSLDRFFRAWFVDPASEPDWSAAWSPSAPSTPTSSPESTPWTSRESSPSPSGFFESARAEQKRQPPTRPRRIRASNAPLSTSALYGTQIECVQVPASDLDFNHPDMLFYSSSAGTSPPGSRFSASPTSTPRLYEYFFDTIELDVAKVVVAAEENMPSSVYPRGRSSTNPYIFVL
ncbi:hypothetical protein JCM10908_000711 [Rhodotorula pacifica]|uniref:uncharacterized protein n=1 Tax=Rhodotorula pacifica TaxID=1495444 RepID=UPI0031707DED